ncbi:beta-lactamase [Exophiala viscosa]|uniref:Beta-lactamase n=1 Tax=Exophiala viscosa TaxID=2486360 RepID=A0AAN6E2G8_9EURO|nr:beta-lactamase [Exophiala viscosa]
MDAKIKPLLEAAVKDKKVPGIAAVLVDSEGNFLLKEAFGTTNLDDMFSTTKLVASIAALQLVEQGKLSLSDPVEKYEPRISKMQVLEGFTDDEPSKPILRAPKSKPTVLQLITHTTGFSYDFFDEPTLKYRLSTGHPPAGYGGESKFEDFNTPLLTDPGTKYIYGTNIDWLGWVVEAVAKTSLAHYVDENILKPLGMNDTGEHLSADNPRMYMHFEVDGKLVVVPEVRNAAEPEESGGGGYLWGTINDYAKLMATVLNNGTSPHTGKSILKPETVKEYLFTDHLPSDIDRSLLGESGNSIPQLSSNGCFFPTLPHQSRGWSCGMLLNLEDLPYGRKKNSGAWAGLGNLYYWIDPTSGLAGMVTTQVFPFFHPVPLKIFDELERVAYGHELAGPEDNDKMNHRSDHPTPSQAKI